jgi:tight adherence protein B
VTRALRTSGWLGAIVLGVILAVPQSAAFADGSASIDHVETTPGQVKLLVSVPGTDSVNLQSVTVHINGTQTSSTAEDASKTGDISRTTVLAIDTSRSMAGARIAEAKKAADAYLNQVPANVKVGIVTFDSQVQTRLAPTLDRSAAKQVVGGLTLSLQTHLYDGVLGAVKALGTSGQRQILLLSDGKDTTGTKISSPIATLKGAHVKLDVVSLQQSDAGNAALNEMASSTGGQVINAQDPAALSTAFTSEADALARQVLVTANVPTTQKAADANVEVSLSAGAQSYTDSAYVQVKPGSGSAKPASDALKPIPLNPDFMIPHDAMLGGVIAIGVGLIVFILALFHRPSSPGTGSAIADQIGVYGVEGGARKKGKPGAANQGGSLTEQARQAAENVLASNRSFEARIAQQLEGAGMALKPSEWLVLHSLIIIGTTAVGIVLAARSPILIVVGIAAGVFLPWLYLKFKKARRLSAFNSGLADTLQLMSGSLSAGLSLAQSLDTIVREGTEPITSEFRRVIVETRLGVPLEDALDGVADRMQSQDFQWVVMAIRIQREVGGNLAELLLTVAATLREREYLRRHVKALSAEGRLSCWILGGLPPGFLLYLTVSKPEYVHILYVTPIGWIMLGVMAVMITVGVFWMSKVAKVDI